MNKGQAESTRRGLVAGLAATLVVSILLLIKQAVGWMPQVNLVTALARALGFQSTAAGWVAHFLIGVVAWGVLFSWVDRHSRLPHWINGVLFASVVWLGVMFIILPAAGEGLFGQRLVLIGTPAVTLVLHWIYGLVLGGVYGLLQPAQWGAASGWLHQHRLRHI